jgi:hypothetical protein
MTYGRDYGQPQYPPQGYGQQYPQEPPWQAQQREGGRLADQGGGARRELRATGADAAAVMWFERFLRSETDSEYHARHLPTLARRPLGVNIHPGGRWVMVARF